MLMYISCATDGAERSPEESRPPQSPPERPESGGRAHSGQDEDEQESVEEDETRENNDSHQSEQDTVDTLDDDILLEMVGAFVRDVHELIANGEYEEWRALLTERYIEHYSDNDVLEAMSESPILKRKNVTLDGLRDYFEHVVRASRTDVEVEDVEVRDENTALALGEVDDEPVVLFNLVRDNEDWKIDRY